MRRRAERLGLRLRPGIDVELIDPSNDPRYDRYWGAYHELMERRGVTARRRATWCAPARP